MSKYKIEHNKPECIGCGVCAALAEKFWEMDNEGKSHLISSKDLDNRQGWETRSIEHHDFKINLESAESCPVNVIHIKDKDGNQII